MAAGAQITFCRHDGALEKGLIINAAAIQKTFHFIWVVGSESSLCPAPVRSLHHRFFTLSPPFLPVALGWAFAVFHKLSTILPSMSTTWCTFVVSPMFEDGLPFPKTV